MYYSELLLPFSIDSGIGLDIENLSVNYNDDVWKSKFDQTRRMSVATKSKQKKVVSILVLITVMFTVVNIPSAISRIMSSPENKEKVSFQVSHTVYIPYPRHLRARLLSKNIFERELSLLSRAPSRE